MIEKNQIRFIPREELYQRIKRFQQYLHTTEIQAA